MKEQIIRIVNMIEENKITPKEGIKLIEDIKILDMEGDYEEIIESVFLDFVSSINAKS